MKKILTLLAIGIVGIGCNKFNDAEIWDSINELDTRVTHLEEICNQININISSLQMIIQALNSNDYITNVSHLSDNSGYLISFTSGKTITIYHGEDGKDGVDGENGYVPKISVKQDVDGEWYWTVDGDWLIVDGHKVKAVGADGKDGADGEDGQDGVDGEDGKDGITPQFKIEH